MKRSISRFVERFAVFTEYSAWPCESIDWTKSYDPILALRRLCLHYSPQVDFLLSWVSIKISVHSPRAWRSLAARPCFRLCFAQPQTRVVEGIRLVKGLIVGIRWDDLS